MRVLMTSTRGAGHIGPLIPFAHGFRRAGADVLVAAARAGAATVHAEGLPGLLGCRLDERAEFAARSLMPEEVSGFTTYVSGDRSLMSRDMGLSCSWRSAWRVSP